MKFTVIDGKDFPNSDKLRGLGAVYGWIQGRALETLVGFSRWLDENNVIQGNGLLLDKIKYIQSKY